MQMMKVSKYTKDENGMDVVRLVSPNMTYNTFDFKKKQNIEISLEKIDYVKPSTLLKGIKDKDYPYNDLLRCAELRAEITSKGENKVFMIDVYPIIEDEKIFGYKADYCGEDWRELSEDEYIPTDLIEEIQMILTADYCTEDEHVIGLINPYRLIKD